MKNEYAQKLVALKWKGKTKDERRRMTEKARLASIEAYKAKKKDLSTY